MAHSTGCIVSYSRSLKSALSNYEGHLKDTKRTRGRLDRNVAPCGRSTNNVIDPLQCHRHTLLFHRLCHHPAKDAASLWWLDLTSRPNGVTTTRWRPPRPRTSFTSHLLIHISPFSPRWCPRPPSTILPGPTLLPPQAFLLSPSYTTSSSVPLFYHLKKECLIRLSVSLLLHLFSLLIRAGLSHIKALSKTHAQFEAVVSMLVGSPSCAWCATSGATATALEFTRCRLLAAGPVELPHMLHPGTTCFAYHRYVYIYISHFIQ